MVETAGELMSTDLVTLPESATLTDAARLMRERAIGDVLVTSDEALVGILTDRDIVVRAVADGADLSNERAGTHASRDVVTVGPDDPLKDVVTKVRNHAVRRVPVVDGGKVVGILSMGDLAIERDETSPLADVSAATPNQ